MRPFDQEILLFLQATFAHHVRMLMVDGGAVNFHGYQRHSADLDFWIEPTPANFEQLFKALESIGFEVGKIPNDVLAQERNMSIKISPMMEVELITRSNPSCTFEEAWSRRIEATILGHPITKYLVIGRSDLIESKLKAGRAKDLHDVHELKLRAGEL
ncbi:MAG: hypothetical protein IPI00_16690 [Flavobacteriales bacterium]|nr:hypothetical protein [Flavobacteriales bacterium]MBK6945653.1 hypothetical protein [Flavobacteriales bacterium]MBK7241758.1 hypothetical protein [Flavobacteriales bacterium]MBK7296240.1 hypothetical protein [Flavobacteriales bacterium]MBK9534795.1 hypothetical protein [Flavobacteriales bacterium]